jgi:PAS domain S-box-containing protein
MTRYDQQSDRQLTELLNELLSDLGQSENRENDFALYLHDLHVHQIELEQQNRELREVRAVLEESRERYADLYDFAPVGYLSLDASGILHDVNLTAAALLGQPRGQLVGRSLAGFVAPEDRKILRSHITETLHAQERRSCELRLLPSKEAPSSQPRLTRMESLVKNHGTLLQIASILTDVTEYRRIEREHRSHMEAAASAKSRNRLITALERLSTAATAPFDRNTRLNGMLGVILDIFGGDRAWLISPCDADVGVVAIRAAAALPDCPGQPFQSRYLTVDPSLRSLMRLALDAGGPIADPDPAASTALCRHAICRSRLVVPVYPDNDRVYLLGLHQCRSARVWSEEDLELAQAIASRLSQILEMLAMQQALTESEERFRGTFEQAAVGICHLSPEGWFLRANPKLCEILGYSEEELITQTCCDITHPDDRKTLRHYVASVKAGSPENNGLEIRQIDARGRTIWCKISMAAMLYAGCHFKYLIAVIEDISARKALEELEHRQRDALARANRISIMGEMSTAIAHEINQPLMAIANYAGGALERIDSTPTDSAPLRDALLEISRLADRAGRIVKGIRDFTAQRPSQPQIIDLRGVVADALRMVGSEIESHRAKVEASFACEAPLALGDPIELEQVIVNLLLNSLDAIKDTPLVDRQVSIQVDCNGADEIEVTIADRGIGFDESVLPRLFEHFFTTKNNGTGLGLPLCRTIIESYGGRIRAKRRHGGGAVVAFTLPAAQGENYT